MAFLKKHMSKHDTIRGYADDLAMVFANLWRSAPAIAAAFAYIGKVSGLETNVGKCILVPVWVGEPLLKITLFLMCLIKI